MSFTTVMFFLFLAAGLVVYYILPRKFQWIWLLVLSYAYYFSFSMKLSVFMVFTTVTIYLGARLIEKIQTDGKQYLDANKANMDKDTKKAYKEKIKHKKRMVVLLMLVLNFGILGCIKYMDFVFIYMRRILAALGLVADSGLAGFALPLGISFYTFQAVSYVIDVYQGKYESEKNPFKFALFVSFFPQLMQGPIGRFDRLGKQLFEGHKFNLTNVQYGIQRVGWGLFKKVVLADRAAVLVKTVFSNYTVYGGWYNIVAVVMYTIQLYMDFSGGIDIVIGVAQMFGITMDENFRQPFFSKSIGEFWRRWHITLGAWMKDYVFYPFTLSKGVNRFGKWVKKHGNSYLGKTLPICIGDLVVFFIVGVWHGNSWKFIIYGVYNGFIIAFSSLMEPVYQKGLKKCHIAPQKNYWKFVQIFRTFILVLIGEFFDMADSARSAFYMIIHSVTDLRFSQLTDGSMFTLGITLRDMCIILFGSIIVLIVSILKEKNISVRESLAQKPILIRWSVYYGLILLILILGWVGETQGFIYANF